MKGSTRGRVVATSPSHHCSAIAVGSQPPSLGHRPAVAPSCPVVPGHPGWSRLLQFQQPCVYLTPRAELLGLKCEACLFFLPSETLRDSYLPGPSSLYLSALVLQVILFALARACLRAFALASLHKLFSSCPWGCPPTASGLYAIFGCPHSFKLDVSPQAPGLLYHGLLVFSLWRTKFLMYYIIHYLSSNICGAFSAWVPPLERQHLRPRDFCFLCSLGFPGA